MFVLAYVGGSWLGRFVVAGVDMTPVNAMARSVPESVTKPLNNSAQKAVAVRLPERQVHDGGRANHVCTGCDAGDTRYRQMAKQMGLPVDEGERADEAGEQERSDAFVEQ